MTWLTNIASNYNLFGYNFVEFVIDGFKAEDIFVILKISIIWDLIQLLVFIAIYVIYCVK